MTDRSAHPLPAPDRGPVPGPGRAGRVAEVPLRGRAGPLRARVWWPGRPAGGAAPALLVWFPAAGGLAPGGSDRLAWELCGLAGVAVLAAPWRAGTGFRDPAPVQDATTAMGWAADHAADLDADPERLLVAGSGPGAGLAAAVALHARDQRWPVLGRQLLLSPAFAAAGPASPLLAGSLSGVAPATVVTAPADPAVPDARRYAARLQAAGVEVELVSCSHRPDDAPALVSELVHVLRHAVGALPRPRAPTGTEHPGPT